MEMTQIASICISFCHLFRCQWESLLASLSCCRWSMQRSASLSMCCKQRWCLL